MLFNISYPYFLNIPNTYKSKKTVWKIKYFYYIMRLQIHNCGSLIFLVIILKIPHFPQ